MCGICGMAGQVDPELLSRMITIIRHRGPDDGGMYISPDGQVGLGNRRLSIIDLSPAGHMPMSNEDRTLWITYNGEVYNFPELRKHLVQRGHQFRSGTDTETILHLYAEHGVEAFKRLNGMFAIAIWDTRRQELVLARDRFGVKPLYYTAAEGRLLFGSEIKSLLLDRRVPREPDPEAIHYFMAHLWVPGPGTMFKHIFKLPPAHFLLWRAGRYEVHPYWNIDWSEANDTHPDDLVRELREILSRAVKRHLIADVPVGLYLSGGLDSSALLGLMSQSSRAPVEAFTIAFREADARLEQAGSADAHYAELVARHFGATFHRILVEPNVVALLPRVLWHLDEPVADPAAISTLLIAEAAKPHLKVLLSGQGADEVFAGYRVHLSERLSRVLAMAPPLLRRRALGFVMRGLAANAERIPGIHTGYLLAFQRYFSKLLAGLDLSPEDRFIFNRSYYADSELLALFRPDLRAKFGAYDAGRQHRKYFAEVPQASFINRMLHVDLKTFLPELNLTYGDKLSMAASIEMRVPFLDYELVEFMARVPPRLKLHRLTGKYLLRRAVADLLPPEILRRRKVGFGAPIRKWLGDDLVEMVDDLLSPSAIRARGYFDPEAVRGLVERHRHGTEDNTYRIWALLTLELWHHIFVDGPVPESTPVFTLPLQNDAVA